MTPKLTCSCSAQAPTVVALAVLLAANLASADLLPSLTFRGLDTLANIASDTVDENGLGPFDDAISSSDTDMGLICPVLNWTADASQMSSFTADGVEALGSVSISIPGSGCATGSGSRATSNAAMRFLTEESREFVLTGSSSNATVRLNTVNGGPVWFERLPEDPGGPISFSVTLPAGGYELFVRGDVVNRPQFNLVTPYSSADFDVELVTTPEGTSVPALGPAALLFLGVALGTVGVLRSRRWA